VAELAVRPPLLQYRVGLLHLVSEVIAGPFPSREEALAAHQRLERAGLARGSPVLQIER